MIDGPTYRLSENLARQSLPNWHLAQDHHVPFDNESFARDPVSNRELYPIFDTFQEHRFEVYMREWDGLSVSDVDLVVEALSDSVMVQLAAFPDRKPRLPCSTTLACFSVFRKIAGWAPQAESVLEIGPGTGFLSLYIKNLPSLKRYAQIEACQGFYLLQSMVNDFAFPYQVDERALPQNLDAALDYHTTANLLFEEPCYVEVPRQARCFHYPWWRIGELMKQPGTVDVVTSNANLREFSPQALRDYLALFKRVLKPSGVVISQCLGGQLWRDYDDLAHELHTAGFAPIVYDLHGGQCELSGPGLEPRLKSFCTGNALLVGATHPLYPKYNRQDYFKGRHFGDEPGVVDMYLPGDGPRHYYTIEELRDLVQARVASRLEARSPITPPIRTGGRSRTSGSQPLVAAAPAPGPAMNPEFLAKRVNALVEKWRSESARVVIYAAGEHTRQLAKHTNVLQANLVGIVDSNANRQKAKFLGFRITSPDAVLELRPDVILISSARFEGEIYRRLSTLEKKGIRVIRIYAPEGST